HALWRHAPPLAGVAPRLAAVEDFGQVTHPGVMENTGAGHGAFVGADGGFIPGGDLLYELAKGPGDGFGGGGGEGVRHHLDLPGEDVQALADGVHVGGGCWFHGGFLLVGGGSAYSG